MGGAQTGASSRWGRARREPVRGCVVADTREMSMFKGDGDGRRFGFLRDRATTVVPNPAGPARLFGRSRGRDDRQRRTSSVGVRRARGATLGRLGLRGGPIPTARGPCHQGRDWDEEFVRPGLGRDEHRVDGAAAQGGRHGGVDARTRWKRRRGMRTTRMRTAGVCAPSARAFDEGEDRRPRPRAPHRRSRRPRKEEGMVRRGVHEEDGARVRAGHPRRRPTSGYGGAFDGLIAPIPGSDRTDRLLVGKEAVQRRGCRRG